MQTVRIGFLGLGNVGGGVYEILKNNAGLIEHREGMRFEVVRALVRDKSKKRTADIPEGLLTCNPDDVLNDPQIDIIAEFLGGVEPARTYILKALNNGKTVVTANKVVLAECWPELERAAKASGAGLYFEASVAGGIPVIRTLRESMQGNNIDKIMGIINGTTNYILTAMHKEGKTYAEVLKQAQSIGLAEPDPALDVEGMDAAYKLSILTSIAFHAKVPVQYVYKEGITKITPEDIESGKELGLTLKLLAIGKKRGTNIEVRVHPTFIPSSHPLASIDGATNAVYIHGDAVGELILSGQGAGALPTGSAVVSDIIYAAHQQGHRYNTFQNNEEASKEVFFNFNWETEYYVSLTVPDMPGVLASIAAIFAKYDVSIASMVQKSTGAPKVPLIFLTHKCKELSLTQAVEDISKLKDVTVRGAIRVEGLDI